MFNLLFYFQFKFASAVMIAFTYTLQLDLLLQLCFSFPSDVEQLLCLDYIFYFQFGALVCNRLHFVVFLSEFYQPRKRATEVERAPVFRVLGVSATLFILQFRWLQKYTSAVGVGVALFLLTQQYYYQAHLRCVGTSRTCAVQAQAQGGMAAFHFFQLLIKSQKTRLDLDSLMTHFFWYGSILVVVLLPQKSSPTFVYYIVSQ